MPKLPDWIQAAREHWTWRGQARPPFAQAPSPGEASVWDFPRPPALAPDSREVVVRWGDLEVARTRRAVRVLETGHPPCFYLPWAASRALALVLAGWLLDWMPPRLIMCVCFLVGGLSMLLFGWPGVTLTR